jgi:hypothetical protein
VPTSLPRITASSGQLARFSGRPLPPITVSAWSLPSAGERLTVTAQYAQAGYAVVQVPGSRATADDLTALADALDLGEPFTPPLYTASSHTSQGVSQLSAAAGGSHPFQGRTGQHVHCDGTLQHLGQIPTTVMMCVAPALEGGASFLVNLVDAFNELHRLGPEAAAQLTHAHALTRTSTFVDHQHVTGPAFAEERPGEWITRYSRTATDTYEALPGAAAALRRALAFLDQVARPGSAYRCEFTLSAGQALVLANDRLGHGRTAYRDGPATPRLLLRGLFTRRPHI